LNELTETFQFKDKSEEGNIVEKEIQLNLKKNILKLKELADNVVLDRSCNNLMIVGANTSLIKYEIETGTVITETPMPIHCMGLICDSEDSIWVHNANNHKLTKMGPEFNVLKEWEGNDDLNLGKRRKIIFF